MNAALRVTRGEPEVREVPLGADARFFGINGTGEGTERQVGVKRYRVGPARGVVRADGLLPGRRQLRPVGQEGGVHARLPGDGRSARRRGRVPRRQQLLVSRVQPRPARVRSRHRAASRVARDFAGQRHLARRKGPCAVEFGRRDGRDLPGGRAAAGVARHGRGRRDPRLPPRQGRRDCGEVPGSDGAVPRDVPAADRAVSLQEVRARRELLGDGLRHADVHAARPRDHPLPVHHQLVLPPRDPAQLVGQLGVRGLRVGQLVRGAHGLSRRPPDPGAARHG